MGTKRQPGARYQRSLSDSKHWFKCLTFGPDVPLDECDQCRWAQQPLLVRAEDHHHGWIAGSQDCALTEYAIDKVFDEIMGEGPFDDDEKENQW